MDSKKTVTYIGVDISKETLEVCLPSGKRTLPYTATGLASLRKALQRSLPAANQLHGNGPGKTVALVYPAHSSQGSLPQCQIRYWAAAHLPSEDRTGGSAFTHLLPESRSLAITRVVDVIVPVKRGESVIDLRLRTVAKPDSDVAVLLAHLGLKLPQGSKLVQNVVEKNR